VARTHILGFPRIGAGRELKFAAEAFWRGDADASQVEDTGRLLRARHWDLQRAARLDFITAGDFSFYDTMLDHTVRIGAVPRRFGFDSAALSLGQYFELARGNRERPAMEMTKWFDTNYHYLVPELEADTQLEAGTRRLFGEVEEAIATGAAVKVAMVGPLTYLRLSKSRIPGFDPLRLLERTLERYVDILRRLGGMGVEWVQLDEPVLCTDLETPWLDGYDIAYRRLADGGVRLLIATYFGTTRDYAERMARLPIGGLHIDAVRAPDTLDLWRRLLPRDWVLSAGVIDGRNIWRNDLRKTLQKLRPLHDALDERLWIAPSCSLLHVPVSLENEDRLDAEVRPWLSFATEKLGELSTLARALTQGDTAVDEDLHASDDALRSRGASRRAMNELVRKQVAQVSDDMVERRSRYEARSSKQRVALGLPPLPTTTIGSFPQTQAVRHARAAYRRKELGALDYLQRLRAEIEATIRTQETLGLDVLVHGEAELNDMVEYFAEHLWGFAITANGWVQSYGSRCVKPPILYGDVSRPEPITIDTIAYAQSLTRRPVKGMLTGPVTMLQWSFVRDDEPRGTVAMQVALAIREEVSDLEKAGIRVIQVDEPALREGLPLKVRDRADYLRWAVRAFRLSVAGVSDDTQIHTHMCYSEFGDILPAIVALDADVITIETSRSNMTLLDAFRKFSYPNEIGPGIYDIHSPRVPAADEMLDLLRRAAEVIPVERLWVNPDCGLKTRAWNETERALRNMVQAAKTLRAELFGENPNCRSLVAPSLQGKQIDRS
jgi:5-methyltetrahydropteroyltriglutamate--homocysteine methyltransferase